MQGFQDRTVSNASVLKPVENVDSVLCSELVALEGGKAEHGSQEPAPAPEAVVKPKKKGRPRKNPSDENGPGRTVSAATKSIPNTTQSATDDISLDIDGLEVQFEESPVDIFLRSVADLRDASCVADSDSEWATFGLRFKVEDYRPSHGVTFAVPDTGARPAPAFDESAEEIANRALKAAFWHAEALQNLSLEPVGNGSETADIDAFLQSTTGAPLVLAFPLTKDYGKHDLSAARILAGPGPDARLLQLLHASAGRCGYTLALAHLTSARYNFDADPHEAWRHAYKGKPGVDTYVDGTRAKAAFARHVRAMRGERVFCGGDMEVEMVLAERNLMREAPGTVSRTRRLVRPPPPAKKQDGGKKQKGEEGGNQADGPVEHKKDGTLAEGETQDDRPIAGEQDDMAAEYKERANQPSLAEINEQPEQQVSAEPAPGDKEHEDDDDDDDDEQSKTKINTMPLKRSGGKRKKAWGRRRKSNRQTPREFPESRCLKGLRARYVNEQEWRRTAILLWKPADHGSVILAHMGTSAIMRNIEASLRTDTQLELPEMAIREALAVLRAPADLWRRVRSRGGRKALMEAMLTWARAAKKPEMQAEIELLWAQHKADEEHKEQEGKDKDKQSSWWNENASEDESHDDASEEDEDDVVAKMLAEEKDWPIDGPDYM